ncbi:MAG: hypothetical protein ACLS8R_06905 [Anaeromassilibacillus sp.]
MAIALYFAIMKVSPPPFCMLDEIGDRSGRRQRRPLCGISAAYDQQHTIYVITHRRGSMEGADVLYGVTMQDEGVSKLWSCGQVKSNKN